MEEESLTEIYKIDRDRLYGNYERVENQLKGRSTEDIVAKFLNNQASIGNTIDDVSEILKYFKEKIIDEKTIIDLAFEWIRAQKIRLEYKKYLIRTIYPNDNINLAIDDIIMTFFIKYDKYIRNLLKNEINEHEISTLLDIFFTPYERKTYDVNKILGKYEKKVPTLLRENHRISTNIITLRAALTDIVINDYKGVMGARLESSQAKEIKFRKSTPLQEEEIRDFNGTNLERILKTYCFNKKEIEPRIIESAVSNFLTSYFIFGKFYEYDEFNEKLIHSLADYINLGLTDKYKEVFPINKLKSIISDDLARFRTIHQIKKLDGVAWINDLKPVLKRFVIYFSDNLFTQTDFVKSQKEIEQEKIEPSPPPEPSIKAEQKGVIDFHQIFDLNLEIDEYRKKLEILLADSDKSMIEKRNIIRTKVQEFKIQKRKH
jgi:hypothetical protein